MRKILILCGPPCSGKTFLQKYLLKKLYKLSNYQPFILGNLSGISFPERKILILTPYKVEEEFPISSFPSTIGEEVIRFITQFSEEERYKDWVIFLESDKLTTAKFLDAISKFPKSTLFLQVNKDNLIRRISERGSKESEKVMEDREKKYNKLIDLYDIIPLKNNSLEELGKNIDFIWSKIEK